MGSVERMLFPRLASRWASGTRAGAGARLLGVSQVQARAGPTHLQLVLRAGGLHVHPKDANGRNRAELGLCHLVPLAVGAVQVV